MKTRLGALVICIIALFSVDLAYGHYPVSPYVYANNNPVRYIDPDGLEWYSYDEEYEEDGETKTRTRYEYREEKMSRKERKEGGYTYLGLVAFTDSEYLSLEGERLDASDHENTLVQLQLDFAQMEYWDMTNHLGAASSYLSGVEWNENLPAVVILSGNFFVVPTKTNTYTSISDGGLLSQYNDYYSSTGGIQFHNPMGKPSLSGEGLMVFEFLVMNGFMPKGWPPSGLNYNTRLRGARNYGTSRMNHYRKAGIIR